MRAPDTRNSAQPAARAHPAGTSAPSSRHPAATGRHSLPDTRLPKSQEEDAVFAEHTDDYWEECDDLQQELFRMTFSPDPVDRSTMKEDVLRSTDLRQTLGLSAELLRIYVVSGISLVTQEAIRRGIPAETVMEIRRRAYVGLSRTNSIEQWAEISAETTSSLRREYLTGINARNEHPLVRRACQYIYLRRTAAITASDVAGHLHVNRSYLARLFREELGTTISDYILQVKMKEAAEWLQSGKYALPEIAANLGFSSYPYFSRRFRQYYGVNPSEFLNAAETL